MQDTKDLKSHLIHFLKNHSLFLIVVLAFFLFKYDQLFYTLFWDEPTYAFPILMNEYEDIFSPESEDSYSYTPHIPGYSLLLYGAKLLFGSSLLSLRLFSFLNFVLILLGIYKLLSRETDSKLFIVGAIISFILIPINIPFSTLIQPDMVVLCTGIWSFYLYRSQQINKYLVISFTSTFVFETCITFIAPIIAYELYKLIKKESSFLSFSKYLISPLPLIGYLIYRKVNTDMFLFHNTILEKNSDSSFDWLNITRAKMQVLEQSLTAIFDLALPFLILFIPFFFLTKLTDKKKVLVYVLWITLAFISFWFLFGEFHARNMISVIAFLAISVFLFASQLKRIQQYITIIFICSILLFKNFHPKWTPDTYHLTYVAGVDVIIQTLKFVYTKYYIDLVTHWPVRVHIEEYAELHGIHYDINLFDIGTVNKPKADYLFIDFEYGGEVDKVIKKVKTGNFTVPFEYHNKYFRSIYFTPNQALNKSNL